MPRLPERGTPAFTAQADQYEAAQRHATVQAAALLHAGAFLISPDGPWAARAFDSILPEQSDITACPHIEATRGPMPMWVPGNGRLACRACLDRAVAELPPRCRGCGMPRPGSLSHRLHIAQREHVLIHGRLCFACATIEHRAKGLR